MTRLGALLLAILLAGAAPVLGQALLADSLEFDRTSVTARGNVEVFRDGVRLTAEALRYDSETDRLSIEGPLSVTDEDGTVILASEAELSGDLREGLLREARLVLDRRLQLSSTAMVRTGGRYTALSRTVASSCRICEGSETPIWEIRANRVVHDQEAQQIYFDGAQFRMLGVPLFWAPRLRLPDPTLDRATGLLAPTIRASSRLGTGFKTPYFFVLGDHADVTVTPYLSPVTRTLEARYRQEFRRGSLRLEGAVSEDDLETGPRAYLFGELDVNLPRGFQLDIDVRSVSDPAYLLDYGYSEEDRLESSAAITRTRDRDLLRARVIDFTTLRGAEQAIADNLPDTLTEIVYRRRMSSDLLGGALWATLDATTVARDSTAPGVGRDVARTGLELAWSRTGILGPGIETRADLVNAVDIYELTQDPAFSSGTTRTAPQAALTFRWPLVRRELSGARQRLTPVAQIAWSNVTGGDVPNEDSRSVEFDEGNLLALSRFPGRDRVERGTRGVLGAEWARTAPGGLSFALTGGRIWRRAGEGQFAEGTGLDGPRSDWLAAIGLSHPIGATVDARVLANDRLDVSRAETRLAWDVARGRIATTWVRAVAEPEEDRPDPLSELRLDADWQLTDAWSARLDGQFDFLTDRATRAGLQIEWRNECIAVALALSRRFTASTSVTPVTDAALSVSFGGIGGGRTGPAGRCG